MTKKAIVFGATSGIGRALAKLLADHDYTVMITGRRMALLDSLNMENPDRFVVMQHDIRDLKATERLFKELPSQFDKVDLIVHNAGIGEPNFDLEWEKDLPTLETNVLGATKVYQLSYNYFKEQGFGHLVGITSIASIIGNRHVPAYHASKAYQSNYLESLWMKARKTRKADIAVTDILPGYVDTDIINGPVFWMAPVDKAVRQIYTAIKKKKRRAYITKRWRLIALILKIVPPKFTLKYF